MTGSNARFTTGQEVVAYLVAHAVGYGITVLINTQILVPLVYPSLVKNHQMSFIAGISFIIFVCVTIVVLFGFLTLRKLFAGNTPAPISAVPVPPAAVPASVYAAPATAAPRDAATSSGAGRIMGVISLVCGILGLTPGLGILVSVIGLILGLIGRRHSAAEGDAGGATLGLIGVILSSITLVIAAFILVTAGSTLFLH